MAFVLEPISAADRDKIVADAQGDAVKHARLAWCMRDVRDFPKRWAVDRAGDRYMLFAPILARQDEMGSALYVFFEGRLYEIRVLGPVTNAVRLVDAPPPALRSEFEAAVTGAFAVFGRSGEGSRDRLGTPLSLVPEFEPST